ncbi:hypothetical protein DYU05_03935 [Mucilaginibacter terrenus]|uniref:Mannosyl-glycoprotein endo-beta-N-acetylglucosamidase-like domain-containing protein n=1 Tax=Mucilaginibacter terrenus TaxID=2482727 RepID=A0A3E2NUU2_9SPHI|nr:glucosaminidase domain-containing protein [Mucilaginibacter terrenus]RFZ84765.1 hypothetical protein DYU05_03935 [Mucilaginibacter terrenus]
MSAIAKTFAEQIAPDVVTACVNTGVFPSVVIAQAIQESAAGQSKQARFFNNLFGHSATKSTGKQTVKGGRFWRFYDSVSEAIQSHINLLKRPLYRLKGVTSAKSPYEQVLAIQKTGYNAGPDRDVYAKKLAAIIKAYNLERYDREMQRIEQEKNTNGLAYAAQPGITLALQNLFG